MTNHNDREKARCVAKVASAAARFGRRMGDKAMGWSERKASEAIGISRQTFRKLKPLWRVRLLAACYASRSVAVTHPSPKGGDHPAALSVESINQSISPCHRRPRSLPLRSPLPPTFHGRPATYAHQGRDGCTAPLAGSTTQPRT